MVCPIHTVDETFGCVCPRSDTVDEVVYSVRRDIGVSEQVVSCVEAWFGINCKDTV